MESCETSGKRESRAPKRVLGWIRCTQRQSGSPHSVGGSRQALSFGVFFFDYDLDGRLDLLQTNGHVENEINTVQPSQHYEQPTQLFWNCGIDCPRNYVAVETEKSGDLARPVVGRGAAFGDIDGDGDLDVVITQTGRAPLVLRNDQATGHHWLRVNLVNSANTDTVYASRVTIRTAKGSQSLWVNPTRSYQSQVELPVTFGLAGVTQVEQLIVVWPDDTQTVVRKPQVDTTITIDKANAG